MNSINFNRQPVHYWPLFYKYAIQFWCNFCQLCCTCNCSLSQVYFGAILSDCQKTSLCWHIREVLAINDFRLCRLARPSNYPRRSHSPNWIPIVLASWEGTAYQNHNNRRFWWGGSPITDHTRSTKAVEMVGRQRKSKTRCSGPTFQWVGRGIKSKWNERKY